MKDKAIIGIADRRAHAGAATRSPGRSSARPGLTLLHRPDPPLRDPQRPASTTGDLLCAANILIWTGVAAVLIAAGYDWAAIFAIGIAGAFGLNAALFRGRAN
jgi:hypothetical protein